MHWRQMLSGDSVHQRRWMQLSARVDDHRMFNALDCCLTLVNICSIMVHVSWYKSDRSSSTLTFHRSSVSPPHPGWWSHWAAQPSPQTLAKLKHLTIKNRSNYKVRVRRARHLRQLTVFLDVEDVRYCLSFVCRGGDHVASLRCLGSHVVGKIKDATGNALIQPLGDAIGVGILHEDRGCLWKAELRARHLKVTSLVTEVTVDELSYTVCACEREFLF